MKANPIFSFQIIIINLFKQKNLELKNDQHANVGFHELVLEQDGYKIFYEDVISQKISDFFLQFSRSSYYTLPYHSYQNGQVYLKIIIQRYYDAS